MTSPLSRALLGLTFGLSLGAVVVGSYAGCSSSSAGPAPAEAGNACPATLDDTEGAACSQEGELCSPTFPCGQYTVTVSCTCTQGTFACVDLSGHSLADGGVPSCGTAPANPASCPATEPEAKGASCTSATVGQLCAYAAECDGGTPFYDSCTCGQNPSSSGFLYTCQNSCQNGTGPLPEAGASTDGGEAGLEASADAPASGDAATE